MVDHDVDVFCPFEIRRDVDAEVVEGLGGQDSVGSEGWVGVPPPLYVTTYEVLVGVWGLEHHEFGLRQVC